MATTAFDFDRWTRRTLADEPPRANSLIVTVFGDAIAPHGGAVWLGGLIDALALLGLSERLARTAVFRLTEAGWFEATRIGRRSLYRLTGQGLRRFANASRRIYRRPAQAWDGSWTLVLFPRSALDAAMRADLRKDLEWEGFGLIAPGVFGRPGADTSMLAASLQDLQLADKVFVLAARDLSGLAARPVRELVPMCWDLDGLDRGYTGFVRRFEPLREALAAGAPIAPRQAFAVRILLVHAYRRVILHDPQFPAELLPSHWSGQLAYDLCRELYLRTCEPADAYLRATLQGEHGPLPLPAPDYYERFGGTSDRATRPY
jgi:phenylacetic acid degradation operon negative regulatory protein